MNVEKLMGPVGSRRRAARWRLGDLWRALRSPDVLLVAAACVAAVLAGDAVDDGRYGSALTLALVSVLAGRLAATCARVDGLLVVFGGRRLSGCWWCSRGSCSWCWRRGGWSPA